MEPHSTVDLRGTVELHWAGPGDEEILVRASSLFDAPVDAAGARDFLARPGHHLCLAMVDGTAVGFVSGTEITHPDKGTEMFLNELGVDDAHRRRGIGTTLVQALAQRADERGCYGMWVLTDHDNEAARGTYVAAGAADPAAPCVMIEWRLDAETG